MHLDASTLREMAGIVGTLGAILQQGVKQRRFVRINPLLVHAGVVAPILLFFASAPLRKRLERAGIGGAGQLTRTEVVDHVRRVTRRLVQGAAA